MQEVPKALLPVANRPVLSYVLEHLEQSNLKDLIVVRVFYIPNFVYLFIYLFVSILYKHVNLKLNLVDSQ